MIHRPAGRSLAAWGALLLPLAASSSDDATRTPPAIHWRTTATPLRVEVTGLSRESLARAERELQSPADRGRRLQVFAEPVDQSAPPAGGLPPMAGTWRVEDGQLQFMPRFPFVPGVRYRAEYRPEGEAPLTSTFAVTPPDATPTTSVRQVYPSSDVLPENQLKFYVEFSAPMSRGGTYAQVQLREEGGGFVELPFLELDEELWDPEMTRLTLLVDPGRIKRGVKPLEDIGPVFEAGKRYQLIVTPACRDAAGRPLQAAFTKSFRVAEADRTPPDPSRWLLTPPPAGTREPLTVTFDEPLDHALALRVIAVSAGADGKIRLAGVPALTSQERTWRFVPAQPWNAGPHVLTVAPTLEDLAGNNPGKTFDVDLKSGAQRRGAERDAKVAFVVR
ncbi:MAG: hypothetical protein JNL92_13635 [Opitutaceae bacterium]|nr:hypothetical protein [Opitutaceae bacterium]